MHTAKSEPQCKRWVWADNDGSAGLTVTNVPLVGDVDGGRGAGERGPLHLILNFAVNLKPIYEVY